MNEQNNELNQVNGNNQPIQPLNNGGNQNILGTQQPVATQPLVNSQVPLANQTVPLNSNSNIVSQDSSVTPVGSNQGAVQVQPNVSSVEEIISPIPQQVQVQPQVQPSVTQVQSQPVQQSVIEGQPVQSQMSQPIQTPQTQNAGQQSVVNQNPINQVSEQSAQVNQQVLANQGQIQSESFGINQNANQDPTTVAPNNTNNATNGILGPSKPVDENNNMTNIGFVAAGSPIPKKKNKLLIIFILLTILAGLIALGIFVIRPYIIKNFLNTPIKVYEATIDGAFKQINSTINDIVHDKAIYDMELSFESNIDELKSYSGYKLGVNFGIDPKSQLLQYGYSLKDPSNIEYSSYSYLKNNNNYIRYSTFRDLIYTGKANLEETNDLFTSFNDLFNTAEVVNTSDLNYLTNKLSQLIIDSIDENKLSNEDASITINGEILKVTNNQYELDHDNLVRTIKYILDGLASDDKVLDIMSNMRHVSKDDIKDSLDSKNINLDSSDSVIYISIYTNGLTSTVVGFSIKKNNDDTDIHYYTKDGYFEFIANVLVENEETFNKEKNKLSIIGKKNENVTNINVLINDEDIMSFDVRAWNNKNIDLDYTLKNEEGDIAGTFKYTQDLNSERLKVNVELSLNIEDEFIKVSFELTNDWTSEVANINTNNAVTLNQDDLSSKQRDFENALYNTSLGDFFRTISGSYDPDINEYYQGANGNNETNNIDDPLDANDTLSDGSSEEI